MFETLKQNWDRLKHDEPGQRFQHYHQRRHESSKHPAMRILLLSAGVLAVILGLVMLIAPGPGIIGCALGAAILAGESQRVARFLDSAELAIRKRVKKKTHS